MDLFATSLAKELDIVSNWLVPLPHRHTLKWGAKTEFFLEAETLGLFLGKFAPILAN